MMVYTMVVYKWPKQLLHKVEMNINNFVWTGNIHKRGAHTIKWKILYKHVEEGGIGLTSLKEFNNACLSKLAIDFLQNKKMWCDFVRKRYNKNGTGIKYYKGSSIWGGIKAGLNCCIGCAIDSWQKIRTFTVERHLT